jgi:hypothetical protein
LANYFAKAEVENQTMGTITSKIENSTLGDAAIYFDQINEVREDYAPILGGMSMPQHLEGRVSNLDKVKRQIIKKQSR